MARRKSAKVNKTIDAPDIKPSRPRRGGRSLKRSAEVGRFQSVMSMLSSYGNRASRNLSGSRKWILNRAKNKLRRLFGRPVRK